LTISGTGDMYDYGAPLSAKTQTSGGNAPWRWNVNIKKLVIDEGVSSIGQGAFVCLGTDSSNGFQPSDIDMGDLSIPSSVKSIGCKAFWGSKFDTVTIPESVISYNSLTTDYSEDIFTVAHIKSLYIESSTIPTFESATIENVYLGNAVTEIPASTFRGSHVTNIYMTDNVTKIGEKAFSQCNQLKKIELPKTVEFGRGLFMESSSLEEIVIPEGWSCADDSAGYEMFLNCTSLKKATINCKIANSTEMFYGCTSLSTVTLKNISFVGYCMFYGCTSLTNFIVPDSVETIYHSAFEGCSSMKKIYIHSAVTTISPHKIGNYYRYVFENCPDNMIIYTGASSRKDGWTENEWNYNGSTLLTVKYNMSLDDYYKDKVDKGDTDVYKGDSSIEIKNNTTNESDNSTATKNNATYESTNKSDNTEKQITKKAQTITAQSKSVEYKSKPFSLNAKTNGNGRLTYTSSNKKVAAISANGKVTVKNYGETTIIIKAAATSEYKSATKKITIKVIPKKMTISKAKSTKKTKVSVTWKKDNSVTGYQMYVGMKKNFIKNTYSKYIKKAKGKIDVTGLKSKKKYYIKMRAYKTVGNKKYYGEWSNIKKIKVK
jgi:hypothetical protein